MSINQQRRALFRRTKVDESVRLPWLKKDLAFTDACTRCADCVKACPEQIIRIGDGGFPEIDFSIAECTFCQKCLDSCSEDMFDKEQELAWHYKAQISERCLNSDLVYCRSCAESCETQALKFNFTDTLFVSPDVVSDDCNGCGACVAICPTKAITVK